MCCCAIYTYLGCPSSLRDDPEGRPLLSSAVVLSLKNTILAFGGRICIHVACRMIQIAAAAASAIAFASASAGDAEMLSFLFRVSITNPFKVELKLIVILASFLPIKS